VAFQSPPSLEVEVRLPNCGVVRGMGIGPGVSLVVGGGFHGKSTLLKALEAGVTNKVRHTPRPLVWEGCSAICLAEGYNAKGMVSRTSWEQNAKRSKVQAWEGFGGGCVGGGGHFRLAYLWVDILMSRRQAPCKVEKSKEAPLLT